jgi:hypothetical protein
MPKNTAALIAGPAGGLASWLVWGSVGPAAVALPVNWAADKLAGAAVRWFKRVRKTDDLSRLVKTATGASIDLNGAEFKDLRKVLEKEETWTLLGKCETKDLTDRIAACLPARGGRTTEDSRKAAETIARGLLEFAVFDLEPDTFQKVVLVRLQQMTDRASALNNALYDLHADLYALYARVDDVADLLKSVMDRLQGPADRAEIVVYLRTLVYWLNIDPWPEDRQLQGPALTPAAIERKLRITATSGAGEGDLDADGLAQQCQRLVILGGSGSGKTWLAKRTARRRAEDALEALVAGATLDEVELPLYTICAHLFNAAAAADKDIREAAVSSALSGIGDLGGSRITAALRLFFTNRNAPTVLVIDSLDEARGSDAPLRRADTLPWRIILTSRPSSWNHQLRIERENDSHLVGELQPLRYPDDVEPFIRRWFDRQPKLSKRLAAQIAQRPDLQQAATVPLILAFYCIIGGDKPLPDRRTALYTLVVRRMLTGRWRGSRVGNDRQPDPGACLPVLRAWAWSGAACNHPVSGVGTWADDIPTDRVRLGDADAEALNHVATPVDDENIDTGKTPRRFVHRSIREQFVADEVAGLPVDDAVEALLPHLWYDPDWEYAAPAALAMHAKRDQVLRELMRRAARSDQIPADLSDIDAGWEFRGFLARAASESNEADWSPELAGIIGRARVELAPSARIEAASWGTSNHHACEALLELLADNTDRSVAAQLVDRVAQLAATAQDKRQAREALLGFLASETDHWMAEKLVAGVAQLDPTAEDKRQARQALLGLLTRETSGWVAQGLARGVSRLDPTAEDRRHAREALLGLLASRTHRSTAADLVGGVAQLATTAQEKRQALEVVLELLAGETDGDEAASLADTVTQLGPTAEDKRQAREALLRLLADQTDGRVAAGLAGTVAGLDPTEDDKRQAREVLLRLLASQADFWVAENLVAGVAQLATTTQDKRQAREAMLELLTSQTNSWSAGCLVRGVVSLDPTEDDKRRARGVLLGLLADQTDGQVSAGLVGAVAFLDPTEGDKRRARGVLLGLLADQTDGQVSAGLVGAVAFLDPTEGDKRQARGALLGLLAEQTDRSPAETLVAAQLAAGVAMLATTAEHIRRAREALLGLLADQTDPSVVAQLATAVAQLATTAEDKREAREALLGLLGGQTDGYAAAGLVDSVAQLDPTTQDKRQALEAVLRLLGGQADMGMAKGLLDRVAQLAATPQDKHQAFEALLGLLAEQSDAWVAQRLTGGMAQLATTAEDKREAREALLGLLGGQTDGYAAAGLAESVAQFGPTPEDKHQARGVLLALLADQTDRAMAERLASVVAQLATTAEDKREAREALLRLLAGQTDGSTAKGLLDWVAQLDLTAEDKRQAREALLRLLPSQANTWVAGELVGGVAQLDPTVRDLSTWHAWAAQPTAELLAAARRNSALDDWLAALPLGQAPGSNVPRSAEDPRQPPGFTVHRVVIPGT